MSPIFEILFICIGAYMVVSSVFFTVGAILSWNEEEIISMREYELEEENEELKEEVARLKKDSDIQWENTVRDLERL